jgi:hypothetical protein
MKYIKIALGLLVFATLQSISFAGERVLSGGYKNISNGGSYVAHWTYVMSFEYNGGEYYCADDEPGQHDYEYNTSLADADSRWDSNSKARDTLSSDYGYSYQTAKAFHDETMMFHLPWK